MSAPAGLFEDVVVLLPGIMGSTLRKGGKEVWGLSGRTVLGAVMDLGRSITDLTLDDPDEDDGVVAGGLLTDTHILPGLWKIDGYTRVIEFLVRELGLVSGHNLREFAYDWRRDNRVAAERLAIEAPRWIAEWRRHLPPGANPRLILVGHSMGGLVARYFLESCDGDKLTRALITFGTPFSGSLNALRALANGMRAGPLDLTTMVRSFPSVYQLLPTYPCIVSNGNVTSVADHRLPGIDANLASRAVSFHSEIKAGTVRRDREAYELHPIVGNMQPTLQSAKLAGGTLEVYEDVTGVDLGGDGTVPARSAIPEELHTQPRGVVFSPERHASLQNAMHVLAHLGGLFALRQGALRSLRELLPTPARGPRGLRVRIDEYVVEGRQIAIRASGVDEDLVAYVTDLDRGTTSPFPLHHVAQGDELSAVIALPVGVYRVVVKAAPHVLNELTPVTELVVVLPAKDSPLYSVPTSPIHWTRDVVTVHADEPVDALVERLKISGAANAIIQRPGFGSYAFTAKEALERAVAGGSVMHALDLHEHGLSEETNARLSAAPSKSTSVPSGGRLVLFENGSPSAVGKRIDGEGRDAQLRAAPISPVHLGQDTEAPKVTVERAPSMQSTPAFAGELVELKIDLRVPTADDKILRFTRVDAAWETLVVDVRLSAPDLVFEDAGSDFGSIVIQRDGGSKPFVTRARVRADLSVGTRVTITATFLHEHRSSGVAMHTFVVEAARPSPTMPAIPSAETTVRAPVAIVTNAPGPTLTVQIHRPDPNRPGALYWMLHVSERVPGLPGRLAGWSSIGGEPQEFLKSLIQGAATMQRGDHMPYFVGVGMRIYGHTPQCFREAYGALRTKYRGFSIQFLLDDPHIPWELMSVDGRTLLLTEHPVARWSLDRQTAMSPSLVSGAIATTAPHYTSHPTWPPLPAAQLESQILQRRLGAIPVPGLKQRFMEIIAGNDGVRRSVLHFAGHGKFVDPLNSAVLLEDRPLHVAEVTSLARRYSADDPGPLVVLNACEVGAGGDVLGTGWSFAHAFLDAGFCGFLAPLWPAFDQDAADHVVALLDGVVRKGRPVATVLHELRARDAASSPTVLSYVFCGDVMASIGR